MTTRTFWSRKDCTNCRYAAAVRRASASVGLTGSLLTSSSTASAAEHLALALKRTGRATLVGETTAGAGHYGRPIPVRRYSVFVPFGRTYDPQAGQGWEGTGVAPDVATPADRALEVALSLAAASADQAVGGS